MPLYSSDVSPCSGAAAEWPLETGLCVCACFVELGESEFLPSENTVDSLKNGNFVERTRFTVTPVSCLTSIPNICVSTSYAIGTPAQPAARMTDVTVTAVHTKTATTNTHCLSVRTQQHGVLVTVAPAVQLGALQWQNECA